MSVPDDQNENKIIVCRNTEKRQGQIMNETIVKFWKKVDEMELWLWMRENERHENVNRTRVLASRVARLKTQS